MQLYKQFSFCPRCGCKYGPEAFEVYDISFECGQCSYTFYQNSIPSATALVPAKNCRTKILMLIRATEPHVGKVALPGGFLRYAEEPAEAAKREVQEEMLLDVKIDRLLCVNLLDYLYLGARVSVLELAFITQPVETDIYGLHTSEASSIDYCDIRELLEQPSNLAFPEHRLVLDSYREWLGGFSSIPQKQSAKSR